MTINNFVTISVVVLLLVITSGCASTSTSTQAPTNTVATDSAITTNVKAAANDDTTFNASAMNVETSMGVVYLSGFVASHAEIVAASESARGVAGVTDVKNDMMVKSLR